MTAFTLAAILLIAGLWLLTPADRRTTERAATASGAPAAAPGGVEPTLAVPAAAHRIPAAPTTRPTATAARAGGFAAADGPGADPAVQAMLGASSPVNLPAALEQRLAQLGRAVWLADLTGIGRDRWPSYFPAAGGSGYTRVRVQAAIARATGPGHVKVTVLWAGTSPAGDVRVGMPAAVDLTLQADGIWQPTR